MKAKVKKERNGRGPKLSEADLVYDRKVAPIIDEVRDRRGMTVEIARQVGLISGSECHRNVVDGWLNPDPKERVRPSWGNGEILWQAVKSARWVMDQKDKPE